MKIAEMIVSFFTLIAALLVTYLFANTDSIVHHQLYDFGLQFSYEWAYPYWTNLRMGFVLAGLIVVGASTNVIRFFWERIKKQHMEQKAHQDAKTTFSSVKSIGVFVSFFTLIAALLVTYLFANTDSIVHHQLYDFGLQFSYEWAYPYWTNLRMGFVLAGLIVVGASTNVIRFFWERIKKQHAARMQTFAQGRPKKRWWSHDSARMRARLAAILVTFVAAVVLAGGIIFSSSVGAMVGVALAFWGILFFLFAPASLVKVDLLDSASSSLLKNVHRLISDFGLKGKGVYLPPRYLRELSGGMIFISADDGAYVPSLDEAKEAENKVFLKNPSGIFLIPSGVSLTNLLERELGTSFVKVDLEFLERNLNKAFVEDLEIAKDFEMNVEDLTVHVRIKESIYKNLCSEVRKIPTACENFGCPLCSSIACALARAAGKPVAIGRSVLSPDEMVMDIYFDVLEG